MVARYLHATPIWPAKNLHCEVTLWSIHSENISVPIPVRFRVSPVFVFEVFNLAKMRFCRKIIDFCVLSNHNFTQKLGELRADFCSLGAIVSSSVRLESSSSRYPQRFGLPYLNPFSQTTLSFGVTVGKGRFDVLCSQCLTGIPEQGRLMRKLLILRMNTNMNMTRMRSR